MIKRLLIFTFCMLALMANAQDVTITGSVTDVNQEPLLGVNIKLKGTTTGLSVTWTVISLLRVLRELR